MRAIEGDRFLHSRQRGWTKQVVIHYPYSDIKNDKYLIEWLRDDGGIGRHRVTLER